MAKGSPGGKGDLPRPKSIDEDSFSDRWEAIFGKKEPNNGYSHESTASESSESTVES